MKGVLLSLVLASLYLLQASDSIDIQPDLDVKQLAGKWNLVALALFEGNPTHYNRHHITVNPQENGDLVYVTEINENNECKRKPTRWIPSGEPGIYTKGRSTVYFMKADYSRYHIFYVDTSVLRVLHLFIRNSEPSDDIIDIFKAAVKSLNWPVDNIIYLHKTDPCPED